MITVGIEKWPKTRGTIANRSTRLKRPSWNRFPAITYTCLISGKGWVSYDRRAGFRRKR